MFVDWAPITIAQSLPSRYFEIHEFHSSSSPMEAGNAFFYFWTLSSIVRCWRNPSTVLIAPTYCWFYGQISLMRTRTGMARARARTSFSNGYNTMPCILIWVGSNDVALGSIELLLLQQRFFRRRNWYLHHFVDIRSFTVLERRQRNIYETRDGGAVITEIEVCTWAGQMQGIKEAFTHNGAGSQWLKHSSQDYSKYINQNWAIVNHIAKKTRNSCFKVE